MILVVTPELNVEDTKIWFSFQVTDTEDVDWYWKFYVENFSSPEG